MYIVYEINLWVDKQGVGVSLVGSLFGATTL